MCKRILAAGFAALLLAVSFLPVSAQTPFIAAYFDLDFTQETEVCQGIGVIDQVHFAAVNWNVFITGAQFAVLYPPALRWLSDVNTQPVTNGTTPTGIATGFATPQNGFFPVFLLSALVEWQCDTCNGFEDQLIQVVPHPLLGPVAVTDFPDFNLLFGVGLTAVVCPTTIPVEETTWGNVKALYSE